MKILKKTMHEMWIVLLMFSILLACQPVQAVELQIIDLQPSTAENYVGTGHSVTATIDPPQSGIDITFTVSGVNDITGIEQTDSNGQATFLYDSNGGAGTDEIQACPPNFNGFASNEGFVLNGGNCLTVSKTWIDITLTQESDLNLVGTEHTVTATIDPQVPGIEITFEVDDGPNEGIAGTETTDINGQATFTYTGTGLAGVDLIEACLGEVCSYNTLEKHWIDISLSPESATNPVGTEHTATASIEASYETDISGITIYFNVINGPNAGKDSTETTDSYGEATFTYTGDGGEGTDEIEACLIVNDNEACSDNTVFKEWTPIEVEVPVDVKPESCRNPLYADDNKGVIPVAILGTNSFDVSQVDISTVMIEGVYPIRSAFKDVATPFEPYTGKTDPFDCTEEGPDGYMDINLKFDSRSVIDALGTVSDGEVITLHLTGELLDGTPIIGEDIVVIIKKR